MPEGKSYAETHGLITIHEAFRKLKKRGFISSTMNGFLITRFKDMSVLDDWFVVAVIQTGNYVKENEVHSFWTVWKQKVNDMWIVVYKDTHQGSYRTSKFFECEDDAWSHYDRLADMDSVDPAMGIRPIGVVEINIPGQFKMRG